MTSLKLFTRGAMHLQGLAPFLICLAFSVFWLPVFSAAERWTDASGKHSVEAEYISLEKEVLVLRSKDGKQIRIAYGNLSKESKKQADAIANENKESPRQNAVSSAIEGADMLESVAKRQRAASSALARYKKFLASPNIEAREKAIAEERISKWQERAKKDLWRLGNQWLPLDKIREKIKDEDRLIQEAHRFIEIGNDELARDRFIKASRRNPESIRGDFYLGILHALIGQNAASAKKSFSKCISRLERSHEELSGIRRSNFIAALNNRAICLARMGKHSQAMKDWDTAIEFAPLTPEFVQNLGYYAKLASVFSGWGLPRRDARRIAEQYAKASVLNRSSAFKENVGWLFVPYIDAPFLPGFEDIQFVDVGNIAEERLNFANISADNELRVASWATGVAVDGQHLLTAKRYVQEAYGLWTTKQGELRREIPGRIVAVSEDSDLALIGFRDLNATALTLTQQETKRADDFWIVSFPEPSLLGNTAQIINGVIIDVKSSSASSEQGYTTKLLYDLQLNRGGEGSPLLDRHGNVIGIDLGKSRASGIVGRRRGAISSNDIRSFLDSTGRDFLAMERGRGEEVKDIEKYAREAADLSVFQIAVVGRAPRLSWTERLSSIRGIREKEGWNALEDPWCVICYGHGKILCNNRGCRNGGIAHRERYVDQYLPGTNKPVYKWKRVIEKCENCSGKGHVTCPHCKGGKREPTL